MKILVKSYHVPIVLIIMGSLMTIAGSMNFADTKKNFLFIAGWAMIFFGVVSWLIPEIGKAIRKRARAQAKAANRAQREGTGPRKYAPQRR